MGSLVTIYIPTFNRLELLKRSINSVLNQTYRNIEIIVVDDYSTDGTQEFLKKISEEDGRIRYFLKETNSGACVSRNIAIKNANGEFITGLDDDDYFEPNRIDLFIQSWGVRDKSVIALCSLYTVKNKDKFISSKKFMKKKIISFNDMFLTNLVGNQVFTETSSLRAINGFNENLDCWQDIDCWLRLLKNGTIQNVMHANYIIDVSHDKPRIGNSQHQKYLKSYGEISRTLELSEKQKAYLYMQTFNCNGVVLERTLILKNFISYPSFSLLVFMIFYLLKGLR